MSKERPLKPSALFTRLFRWFCESDFFEELQGDLEEKFFENAERLGPKKAQQLYAKEVLLMVRPSVIKRPVRLRKMLMLSMLYMHFKLTMRNIARHKVFSAVNVFGLAAALAGSLFVVNMLYTGYRMDRQHEDHHRIFRIDTRITDTKSGSFNLATTSHPFAEKIRKEIPEIEVLAEVNHESRQVLKVSDEMIPIRGVMVDSTFLDIFNVEVIEGDLNKVFEDINSIAITDALAKRIFQGENVIGKISAEGNVIRAVVASPYSKSNITYDFIGNIMTERAAMSESARKQDNTPDFIGLTSAYFKISKESTRKQLDEKLAIASAEFQKVIGEDPDALSFDRKYEFSSRSITKLNFHGKDANTFHYYVSGSDSLYLYLILIVLLALATFNYTNLSAARAIQRTKEISIRKINGSGSREIIAQYLVETVVFSLLAMLLSLVIHKILLDKALMLQPELVSVLDQSLDPDLLLAFLTYAVFVGIIAGLLPAFHFAKITPLSIFRTRVKNHGLSLIGLRKVMTGTQLTISMFCILFITIGIRQYQALLNAPFNFSQENIIAIHADKKSLPILKQKVLQIKGVESASMLTSMPGLDLYTGFEVTPEIDGTDTLWTRMASVDESFQEVFKIKPIAGRLFTAEDQELTALSTMVDPNFLRAFSLTAEEALDKTFKIPGSTATLRIVGVLDKYTFGSLVFSSHVPYILIHQKIPAYRNIGQLALKFENQDPLEILTQLEEVYEEVIPYEKFDPYFLEDRIDQSYGGFKNTIELLSYLGVIVIMVSILGQVGISLYNAETRVKEIGIRKVLGADLLSILRLLLKGTSISLLIASCIAAPAISWVYKTIIFPGHGYTTPIGIVELGSGILLLTTLVMGLVTLQTWRVARAQPAESLRYE